MINYNDKDFYSVSEVNEYIKTLFDNTLTLKNIGIVGEIINFKGQNKSGHYYFNIKDEKASINVVIFKFDCFNMDLDLKNGDKILIIGNISSYPQSSSYQMIGKKIIHYGEGELILKLKKLKEKLEKEGLFKNEFKKEIPLYPLKIAIVTGKNSAAQKDFEYNLKRRWPIATLKFYESLVQGDGALNSIIKALNDAIDDSPDLIILGRGGGSSEDLDIFNNEEIVRFIYKCQIPLISAIGHEINKTLCDFVADKYASTPTGACEIAVPDINDVIVDLEQIKDHIDSLFTYKIKEYELKIEKIKSSSKLVSFESLLKTKISTVENYETKILNNFKMKISKFLFSLNKVEDAIELKNPNNILNKGYAIIFKNNHIITSINDINENDTLNIRLKDGDIEIKVEDINHGKK